MIVPSFSHALNLISSATWFGNGGYKIPQQDMWPLVTCTTCTITLNWDGTTAKLSGFKNEMVGGMLTISAGSSNATNVSVAVSPLVGPNGSVISSTPTLCAGVTNYTTRDFEIFVATYNQLLGGSEFAYQNNFPPFDERDLPVNYRNPCTVDGNNDCVANGSNLWSTRPQANKFIPDALIPQECESSYTVFASSSQGIWIDFYLRKDLNVGVYNGTITVSEGVSVSSSIPVQITVNNGTMPDKPSFPYIAYISEDDVNYRLNGISHNAGCSTAACISTDEAFYQALWRHRIIPVGDVPDVNTNDYPSTRYQEQLNGTLFTSARGYQGPGVNTAVPIYSIGTYGNWNHNPNWDTTCDSNFKVQTSSWGAWFKNNAPNTRVFVYWSDEPSTTTLASTVNAYSTCISTNSSAQTPGFTVHSWVTNQWPRVSAYAPYIDNPATTNWIDKLFVLPTDWSNAATKYLTIGSTQGWAYNGGSPWIGPCENSDDDGMGCWESVWALKFKGVQGFFEWQTTNWFNPANQIPAENPLWNNGGSPSTSKTFGYDVYPATSSIKGHYGFNFENGDGIQMYPGTEVSTYTVNNLGFLGPVVSLKMKYIRRSIQDADYIQMANSINPSSTTAIVSSMVGGSALWDLACFTQSDCSYNFGGRLWSQDPNAWELSRQRLALIITGVPSPSVAISGNVKIHGNVIINK